jgi:DNA-binding MarR family transcriptional regulator
VEVPGVRRDRLPVTIDREAYTPAYLVLVANALSWGTSHSFARPFGVGVNDWRLISALGNHPGATAVEVCRVLGLNKSVVSRSVAGLARRGLIVVERADGRRRLFLTDDGARLHDELLPAALQREQLLLSGFDAAEVAQLRRFLRRMYLNLSAADSGVEGASDESPIGFSLADREAPADLDDGA